jgi:hypothetical protein
MKTKPPLAIYVISHKEFSQRASYHNKIYSTFNTDVEDYLLRGINIPVYFSDGTKEIVPNYEKIIVILLIDTKLIRDSDLLKLEYLMASDIFFVISVAINKNAHKLHPSIGGKQYIKVCAQEENRQLDSALFEIAHTINRVILGVERLKVFLSHAKKDGEKLAKRFKCYIDSETKLDNYFDTTDTQTSDTWKDVIEDEIQKSVLLVLHTDKYGTREWCKKEVLLAKKYGKPIVVLKVMENGEDRSFPYMANVPTTRFKDENSYEATVLLILLESIRHYYHKKFIAYFMELFFPNTNYHALYEAPELLTLTYHKSQTYIYPDPPLGSEELELFKEFDAGINLYTPLTYITQYLKSNATPYRIAISVSESEDIGVYGLDELHLRDCIIELARYLLASNQQLMYGGDINYHGFNLAEIIKNTVKTYNGNYQNRSVIQNYLAYNYYETLDDDLEVELSGLVEFIKIEPDTPTFENELEKKFVIAKTLTKMRERMSNEMDIRIVAGGKITGFSGRYPGILEESYLTLKAEKPLFLIGAFGGAAKLVIDALKGAQPKAFTQAYQRQHNVKFKALNEKYQQDGLQYQEIVRELNSMGIKALHNGLSDEENQELFESQNIYKIIYLVLKGVAHYGRKKTQ